MSKKFFRKIFKKSEHQKITKNTIISEPKLTSCHSEIVRFNHELNYKIQNGKYLDSKDMFQIFTGGNQGKLNILSEYNIKNQLDEIQDSFSKYNSSFESPIPDPDSKTFVSDATKNNANLVRTQKEVVETLVQNAEKFDEMSKNPNLTAEQLTLVQQLHGRCVNMAMHVQQQTPKIAKLYDSTMTMRTSSDTEKRNQFVGKTYRDIFPKVNVYKKDEKAVALDKGSVNTVYSVEIDDQRFVFKKGQTHLTSLDPNLATSTLLQRVEPQYDGSKNRKNAPEFNLAKGLNTFQLEKDLDAGDITYRIRNANTAQRDVAVSRVNALFNLQACADTQLAIDTDGAYSSALEFVAAPKNSNRLFSTDDKESQFVEERKNKLLAEATTEKSKNDIQSRGVLYVKDMSLNRSLMNMAALNYLTGHSDRHPGNYMIKDVLGSDGKTTYQAIAIDNDLSFGHTDVIGRGQNNPPIVTLKDNFPIIEQELADKIQSITKDELADSLRGLLDEQQIKVATDRLQNFKNYLDSGEPNIVPSLNKNHVKQLQKAEYQHGSLNANLVACVVKDLNLPRKSRQDLNSLSDTARNHMYASLPYNRFWEIYTKGNSGESDDKFTRDEIEEIISTKNNDYELTSNLSAGYKYKHINTLTTEDLTYFWDKSKSSNSTISREEILLHAKNPATLLNVLPQEEVKQEMHSLRQSAQQLREDLDNNKIPNSDLRFSKEKLDLANSVSKLYMENMLEKAQPGKTQLGKTSEPKKSVNFASLSESKERKFGNLIGANRNKVASKTHTNQEKTPISNDGMSR